jgi:hypothetical protein
MFNAMEHEGAEQNLASCIFGSLLLSQAGFQSLAPGFEHRQAFVNTLSHSPSSF